MDQVILFKDKIISMYEYRIHFNNYYRNIFQSEANFNFVKINVYFIVDTNVHEAMRPLREINYINFFTLMHYDDVRHWDDLENLEKLCESSYVKSISP